MMGFFLLLLLLYVTVYDSKLFSLFYYICFKLVLFLHFTLLLWFVGEVAKVSRYGKPTAPVAYHRIATSSTTSTVAVDDTNTTAVLQSSSGSNDMKNKNKELRHYAAVSYMTVRPAPSATSQLAARAQQQQQQREQGEGSNNPHRGEEKDHSEPSNTTDTGTTTSSYSSRNMLSRAPLLLVGRVDGTVDLFHLEDDAPIYTWDLTTFTTTTNNDKRKNEKHKIIFIQWSSTHPNSFFIADNSSHLYHFNMLINATKPINIEIINITDILNTNKFDISKPRLITGNYFIATINNNKNNDTLNIHRGNNKIHKTNANQYETDEILLYENLYLFTSMRNNAHIVNFIPHSSSSNGSSNRNDEKNYKK